MSETLHRIRRLTWMVHCRPEHEPLRLRQTLRSRWAELMPAVSAELDRVTTGTEWIHVSRIEVRLRIAPGDEMSEGFQERIVQMLASELEKVRRSRSPVEGRDTPLPHAQEESAALLIEYLETGKLLWFAAELPREQVLRELSLIARRSIPELVRRASGGGREALLFRLLALTGEAGDKEIAAALVRSSGLFAEQGALVTQSIQTILFSEVLSQHDRLLFAAGLLAVALASGARMVEGADLRRKLEAVMHPSTFLQAMRVLNEHAPGAAARLFAPKVSIADVGSRLLGGPPSEEMVASGGQASAEPVRLPGEDALAAERAHARPARVHETLPSTPVRHAGLVLLHPFVVRFFDRVALLTGDRLADKDLPHAAALLSYLATGSDAPQEFELGLIKVLLGLEPGDELLVAGGLVTDAEAMAADELLETVIAHWKVLQSTSIKGLRSAFLSRGGKLWEEETVGRLLVEPQSFDMLLGQLPWSIGIVRLRWMRRPVHVEWSTTP